MSELLPCPFCGGEAEVIQADHPSYTPHSEGWYVICKCGATLGYHGTDELYMTYGDFATEYWAIKAWNTRTMGGGKLTAEQLREAIMSADRWEKPMGNTGLTNTHLIIRDDGWQAIADELNATLGVGECEIETTESWLSAERYHRCKYCGAFFAVMDASGDIPPCVCPNCGKAVKR